MYQQVRALLAAGGWTVEDARDGLLLLARRDGSPPTSVGDLPAEFYSFVRVDAPLAGAGRAGASLAEPRVSFLNGALELRTAELVPSPSAAITPGGPTRVLRTTWRTTGPLPQWVWPHFRLAVRDGEEVEAWDLPALWWYPPERWLPEDEIRIDVPNVPWKGPAAWTASVEPPADQNAQPAERVTQASTVLGGDRIPLGELTLQVGEDPWSLRVLDPAGAVVWQEADDQPVGFRLADGARWRATRLLAATRPEPGAVRLLAATDDPAGRVLVVEAHSLGPRVFRLTIVPSEPAGVQAIGGAIRASEDEQLVGLGERFTGVNQRGHLVDVWAEDRVLAGYGDSTYAILLANSAGLV